MNMVLKDFDAGKLVMKSIETKDHS